MIPRRPISAPSSSIDHRRLRAAAPFGQSHPAVQGSRRLERWLVEEALPLWWTHGVDWQQGGFHEQLDQFARAVEEPRRARVVARQVYVFATALRHGWHPAARQALEQGLRFLLGPLRLANGGFAAAVHPDGTVVRDGFDLYEHAFILFAMASAHQAAPDEALPRLAKDLLARMRDGWKHAEAGFHESRPPSLPLKANPHMHLLEAALAWSEVAPEADRLLWADLADELAQLSLVRFIDQATGAVREYFDAAWQPMEGPTPGVVEPGHQFEWAWLLVRWGRLRGRDDALDAARRMARLGEDFGVDRVRGVAINELNAALRIVDASAKLWPQTERVKAWCILAGEADDDAEAAEAMEKTSEAIAGLTAYVQGVPAGLWSESLNAEGIFLRGNTRASSLYHIVCAIESLRALPGNRPVAEGTVALDGGDAARSRAGFDDSES